MSFILLLFFLFFLFVSTSFFRDKVKEWVRRMVRQIKNVHIDDCVLISAATGEGFEDLERRLEILLQTNERSSINLAGAGRRGGGPASAGSEEAGGGRLHLHAGTIFMKRATGGVTRSALPGTTLSFISFGLPRGYKLIDTPGIPSNTQMTSRLPYAADLFSIVPSKRLQPITYALTEGKTLLIGAMVRIDLVGGSTALITCYFSHKVTLHICKTVKAADLLKRKACTFLYPPHLPDGFDKIQPLVKHRVKVYAGSNCAYDDISIAGLGWVSISGGSAGMKELDVWAPEGVKIFRRPAMLPLQLRITGVEEFHGKSPRARGPRINVKKKKMVEALRDQERREKLHAELAEREERFLSSHATHLFPSNSDSSNSELPSECSSIAKISSAYDGEDEENVREKEIGEKGEGEKEENRKREAMRTDVRSPCFSSSSVLSSLDLNEAPPSSSSILLEKREKKTNRREGRRSSEDENEEEEGVILGGGGIDRDLINQHGEYQEESRGIKMRCNSLDSSAHVATDESSWVSLVLDRERRLVEEKGLERERDRHEEEEEEKTRMTTYHPDSPLVAAGMKEEIEALLSQVANEEKELEKVRFQEKDKATDAETRDVRIQKQL
ncbi:hypothetical protein CSUI_007589 [Cystoisospora suis]|uniref:NOA1/YqeH-like C-terminal domain-containing protein n=1 Tax=Cystoisospora suis TaxID=483139 RepID=A0A2C6KQ30_9APIC|nr:hypothetical protein CSUI_007589 [Cystoisospora suis]